MKNTNDATVLAPHDTSVLCVRSAGSSRRSTRAKPHAPPFASLDGALPKASTPLVHTGVRGTFARPAICCASKRMRSVPRDEGAVDPLPVRTSAIACHEDGAETKGFPLQ